MEASYYISQRDSEYRIMLSPANLNILTEEIKTLIYKEGIDVSELIIDRVKGDSMTEQEILHDIKDVSGK
mgnify:CR=1 FL=1